MFITVPYSFDITGKVTQQVSRKISGSVFVGLIWNQVRMRASLKDDAKDMENG